MLKPVTLKLAVRFPVTPAIPVAAAALGSGQFPRAVVRLDLEAAAARNDQKQRARQAMTNHFVSARATAKFLRQQSLRPMSSRAFSML